MDTSEEDKLLEEWEMLDYDNDLCTHCGSFHLCICSNGKHRCEKCNWSPELNGYAPVDFFDYWRGISP